MLGNGSLNLADESDGEEEPDVGVRTAGELTGAPKVIW